MFGAFAAGRAQRQQAEAYRRMAKRMMEAQEDAADRAFAEGMYSGWLSPPPFRKINGKWYAIVEGKSPIPTIPKRRPALLLPAPQSPQVTKTT